MKGLDQPSQDQTDTAASIEGPTHERLYYVLTSIQGFIPDDLTDHPMAKMLAVFCREARKDLRRIPEEFIQGLSRSIAQAFAFVADGDMADVEEMEQAAREEFETAAQGG